MTMKSLGLTYRYLSIRYRSRSSRIDQARPAMPLRTSAQSAVPTTTNPRNASVALPPITSIITTKIRVEASGFATE
jgi:hypothetical protein